MGKFKEIGEKIFTKLSIGYIEFAFKTSKVIKSGNYDLLDSENPERFVVGFWHGNSYCCFPVLRDTGTFILTTVTKRGDYIKNIGEHFKYNALRVPDETEGENHIFKIRRAINGAKKGTIAFALDGPLGPYHEVKKFVLLTTLLAKRRMIPVSFDVKRKIRLVRRWDKYVVPLPFNKIEVHFHDPIEITKQNLDELGDKIVEIMGEK